MRLFVAIKIPDFVIQKVTQAQKILIDNAADNIVKWVEPYNFHLTVKFLGNTHPAKLSEVKDRLRRVSLNHYGPFQLQITGLGTFPNMRMAKVIWAGVEGDLENFKKIHLDVDNEMQLVGYPKEKRKFSSHLTLGRVREKLPQDFQDFLKLQTFSSPAFSVNSISLFQSDLTPDGPIYSEVSQFFL